MRIPKGILKIGKCAVPDAEVAPMSTVRIMRVTGDRCLAEVTDGSSAVRISFKEPASSHLFGYGIEENPIEGVDQLVPGDVAVKADQSIPKDPGYAILDEKPPANQIAVVVPGAAQQQRWDAAMVSGEFPDIGGVVRNYEPVDVAEGPRVACAMISINPEILIACLKALADATERTGHSVLMEVPLRRGKPIQFRCGRYNSDSVEGIALVMPVNDDHPRRRVELADGKPDPEPQPHLPGVQADDLREGVKEHFGDGATVEDGPRGPTITVNADDLPNRKGRKGAKVQESERRNVTTADGRKITAREMMVEIGATFAKRR